MKSKLRSAFNTRQHMTEQDFEIYYYSDVNFQSVGRHSHDYYEFYIFIDGDVSMELRDQKIPLKTGDIVLVPPGVVHRGVVHSPEKPYRRFVFWISKEYCQRLSEESVDYIWLMQEAAVNHRYVYRLRESDFHTIQAKVIRLLEETNTDRYGKDAMISLSVNDLILTLNRRVYETEHQSHNREEQDLFAKILSYINSHISESLALEDISEAFYLSRYYISHLFKENLGISIHQYIIKKRLEFIAGAIINEANITDACTEYGFNDYSSFYRAFRKEYGISPNEYRQIHAIKEDASPV
ncbi:MAG: AraC family transcriptional regulator [Solobacterium sp.]|nr:AraC family transcriptional regulator [Solobacterium sp.]